MNPQTTEYLMLRLCVAPPCIALGMIGSRAWDKGNLFLMSPVLIAGFVLVMYAWGLDERRIDKRYSEEDDLDEAPWSREMDRMGILGTVAYACFIAFILSLMTFIVHEMDHQKKLVIGTEAHHHNMQQATMILSRDKNDAAANQFMLRALSDPYRFNK